MRVSDKYDIPLGTVFTHRKTGDKWIFVGYHYTTEGPSACFTNALTGREPINTLYPWNYRVSIASTFEDKFLDTWRYLK